MTPEGRVKKKIKEILDKYVTILYVYMPVPGGFGKSTLDYLCCYRSLFFAIEAKRAGKHPTERQEGVIDDIERAGGKIFRINDENGLAELDAWLIMVTEME